MNREGRGWRLDWAQSEGGGGGEGVGGEGGACLLTLTRVSNVF